MQNAISTKIVIVGDGAIGKTCVMVRYAEGTFDTDYTPTIFQNRTKQVFVQGKTVHQSLWDTAGQEQYSYLRPIAYPNTDVFLIAFSVVEPSSFVNAKKVWHREVKTAVPDCKILFVGTKADLRSSVNTTGRVDLAAREIERNVKEELNAQYRQCSALTGEGVEQIFTLATKMALIKQGHLKNIPSNLNPKSFSKSSSKSVSRSSQVPAQQKYSPNQKGCNCLLM